MGSMTPYASATLLGCIMLGVKILDNPRVGISCKTAGLGSIQRSVSQNTAEKLSQIERN